jgi:translocon-associated protein subunit alpha
LYYTELHAGKAVEFLVGFTNKGKNPFTLESLDASFRYPQDYSFHIQNFTALQYNRVIKPKEQATLSYSFYTDESFAGRPFGLVVSLGYRDAVS